jgi:pimeloyl-ACP methyl ester carboxylesterase
MTAVTITTETTLADLSAGAVITEHAVTFPGARPPDRRRDVDADGMRIAVHEWGDPDARPLLLAHGGMDFARTFDVFAPLLAAGGWRVISWDHRSHGDSDWAALTNWSSDARDAFHVLQSIDGPHARRPVPIIGHSKGGAMSLRLAEALPHRFSKVVNIDGMPSKRSAPDISDTERSRMLGTDLTGWLDNRRKAADGQRKPGTLAELAKRRGLMNPRLTPEWLAYLASVGARRSDDGWRWKTDPMLRPGGFGPWRPEWMLQTLVTLSLPFLGYLCTHMEPMGWTTKPADVAPYMPRGGRVELIESGHFIHIERPGLVAAQVLEFLG